MRKLIAVMNMTIDGFCDHTSMLPDEELHLHYAAVLRNAGAVLYGRKTYELMTYWKTVVEEPTGEAAMDEFAKTIETIPKVVFSHTLKDAGWKNARIAQRDLREEISALKQEPGKDVLVGSPGLIVQATQLQLVDEYQLCVHPVVAGSGLPLFRDIRDKVMFTLLGTKTFGSGAVMFYYAPAKA